MSLTPSWSMSYAITIASSGVISSEPGGALVELAASTALEASIVAWAPSAKSIDALKFSCRFAQSLNPISCSPGVSEAGQPATPVLLRSRPGEGNVPGSIAPLLFQSTGPPLTDTTFGFVPWNGTETGGPKMMLPVNAPTPADSVRFVSSNPIAGP